MAAPRNAETRSPPSLLPPRTAAAAHGLLASPWPPSPHTPLPGRLVLAAAFTAFCTHTRSAAARSDRWMSV
uniref:Uncharacterized protein n=1 Tax=Arundo donax TaxID=35708 RepID=A0A0A9E2B6_ARUDO